jgi:hypothetical protein
VSARDAGIHDSSPICSGISIENAIDVLENVKCVPPGRDACDGPGSRMHIVEVRGCWDDLFA